jgi:hypothetical protein
MPCQLIRPVRRLAKGGNSAAALGGIKVGKVPGRATAARRACLHLQEIQANPSRYLRCCYVICAQ